MTTERGWAEQHEKAIADMILLRVTQACEKVISWADLRCFMHQIVVSERDASALRAERETIEKCQAEVDAKLSKYGLCGIINLHSLGGKNG